MKDRLTITVIISFIMMIFLFYSLRVMYGQKYSITNPNNIKGEKKSILEKNLAKY